MANSKIYLGNTNIGSLFQGASDISIYLGDEKVYPNDEPTPPTPLNVITYEASAKLTQTTNIYLNGLHVNAFSGSDGQQLTMTSHTFENGVGTIEFDGDIASISTRAFKGCGSLTSIDIPNSVTKIDEGAFVDCTSLTSIDIPNSVTSISGEAFRECTSLTSCTIGSGVTSIGKSAFNSCRSLTSVIVNVVTPPTLGSGAFDNTNDCPIYVPSQSLEAYKSAANWSDYASRLQSIP